MKWLTSPTVVFTGDQDWCPEWAIEKAIEVFTNLKVPFHVFRTNNSELLDLLLRRGDHLFTQGWHPNFLPESTHGESIEEVISEMNRIVPQARTLRNHSFVESTPIWESLIKTSVIAESNSLTDMQPYIMGMLMWNGMIRLPVFLEDDVHFSRNRNEKLMKRLWENLKLPGLKIFNFHPIHIALNTSSIVQYDDWKFSNSSRLHTEPFSGDGTRVLLEQIVEFCNSHNIHISSFEQVVEEAVRELKN